MHRAVKRFTELALKKLLMEKDSILQAMIAEKTSHAILNQAVYTHIKNGEYDRAVALAQILNLLQPGESNYIDTLGEAYYAAGNTVMATYYSEMLQKLDPQSEAGLKTWEHNKKNNSY